MTDEEYTQIQFRTCFSTPSGKVTLGIILADLGYFDNDINPDEVCKANYAKTILKYMGLCEKDTVSSFIDNILNVPVIQEKRDGDN
jgi:hypothetical protein